MPKQLEQSCFVTGPLQYDAMQKSCYYISYQIMRRVTFLSDPV
jgi:hypothetical protein